MNYLFYLSAMFFKEFFDNIDMILFQWKNSRWGLFFVFKIVFDDLFQSVGGFTHSGDNYEGILMTHRSENGYKILNPCYIFYRSTSKFNTFIV